MNIKEGLSSAQQEYRERKALNRREPPQRIDHLVEMFTNIWHTITPTAHRGIKLESLTPDVEKCIAPFDFQQATIDLVRANPLGGYAFFGPSGCGKTTIMTALKRQALRFCVKNRDAYFPVHATPMPQWVEGMTRHQFTQGPHPTMYGERANEAYKAGGVARFYIDEFDKVTGSDFINLHVTNLILQIYEGLGTLTLATNKNQEEFRRQFGDHVMSRVKANCEIIDYFEVFK